MFSDVQAFGSTVGNGVALEGTNPACPLTRLIDLCSAFFQYRGRGPQGTYLLCAIRSVRTYAFPVARGRIPTFGRNILPLVGKFLPLVRFSLPLVGTRCVYLPKVAFRHLRYSMRFYQRYKQDDVPTKGKVHTPCTYQR